MKNIVLSFFNHRIFFLFFLTVLVGLVFTILSPYFLTSYNITQILHFAALIFLLSIGQNLVILSGGMGIDLSVGSIMSLTGIILGLSYKTGIPLVLSISIAIIFGAILGSFNAFCILKFKIPPLIATLATLYMYGGLALVLNESGTISGFPESFEWIGQDTILGIPVKIVFILLPIYLSVLFILKKTELGRNIYLIGKNEVAARFAGIEVSKIRFYLYLFSGLLSGIGGIIMTSYLMTAKADVGRDFELQTIVVVMLAGTSIKGGTGKLENILFSTLIITMISTGLQLAQINAIWQMGILGLILLLAVLTNQFLDIFNKKEILVHAK